MNVTFFILGLVLTLVVTFISVSVNYGFEKGFLEVEKSFILITLLYNYFSF